MYKYLVVDGMVSGTGIRDQYKGGYIDPEMLKISDGLIEKINNWHEKYKQEFYKNYVDTIKVRLLDKEGFEIADAISSEIENCKVSYFSDADLKAQKI